MGEFAVGVRRKTPSLGTQHHRAMSRSGDDPGERDVQVHAIAAIGRQAARDLSPDEPEAVEFANMSVTQKVLEAPFGHGAEEVPDPPCGGGFIG